MTPHVQMPAIKCGPITDMFIEAKFNHLYFQKGTFHDEIKVGYEIFDMKKMSIVDSVYINNYKV